MRRVALALVGTIAGLFALLSFKANGVSTSATPAAITATGPDTGSSSGAGTPSSGTPTSTGKSSTSSGSSSTSTKTVTGDSVDTRWGPVQVRITVKNGSLSSVTAIEYPVTNGRDQEINAVAIPTLTKETIAAGNAKIDMVSGATYTSQGYIGSLQSALDKAGLS
jgi:uncharacterized protein with FMN-binding domain